MSDFLKDLLASGKTFISDTKTPKQLKTVGKSDKKGIPNPAAGSMPGETDRHKIFISRAINEKLKAKDIVKEIQKICEDEDSKL